MARSVVAVALVLLASGCAHDKQSTTGPERAVSPISPIKPVVYGERAGLEVRWWPVSGGVGDIGAVLAPYAGEWSPEGHSGRVLRESGIRMVRVPADMYQQVERELRPTTIVERHWLGVKTDWAAILTSQPMHAQRALVGGAVERVPGGLPRVLARDWVEPGGDGPSLRIDLAFQIVTPDPSRSDPFREPVVQRPIEMGPVLGSLSLSLRTEPGWVYVFTAERPSTDWSSSEAPADADEEVPAEPSIPGPAAPKVVTAGDLFLSRRGLRNRSVQERVLLVLIPRLPGGAGEYRLLP